MIIKRCGIFDRRPEDADIVVFTNGRLGESSREALALAACGGSPEGGAAALGGLVLRTRERELGFYCDPLSLESKSAHNFAFAATRAALQAAGGPDESMGAGAALDLIRRFKAAGFESVYAPEAELEGDFEPEPYAGLVYANLALALRYGSLADIWRAKMCWLRAFKNPGGYHTSREELSRAVLTRFWRLWRVFFGRFGRYKALRNSYKTPRTASLGLVRGEIVLEESPEKPLVSLVTRTRNRPETLRRTLECLRRQTYGNFEVVVIEDGEALSSQMIKRDFCDLNIVYKATIENVGRAAAARLGFELARGEWLALLDDDDYLYPEHIELGLAKAAESGADIVFLRGIALEIEKKSEAPYSFEVKNRRVLDFPRVDAFTMARRCVTAQNGVLFKKSLYESVGGMRADMGAHEDWNLWLRLLTRGESVVLPYITCCYIVPADREAERQRLMNYARFDHQLLDDEALIFEMSAERLREAYESVIHDYAYLFSLDLALEHLAAEYAKAAPFIEERGEESLHFESIMDGESHTLSGWQLRELYENLIIDFERMRERGALKSFIKNELKEIT
ncbi:MAG: glycosyltransferase family A protein [Oscillospiraceae bacterium]|nr:glycosyltransferase family A protein [Oscillospiraceae bacterium]